MDNELGIRNWEGFRTPEREKRISKDFEQVLSSRRTSSKGAENKFKRSGEQVQNLPRTGSFFGEGISPAENEEMVRKFMKENEEKNMS